MTAVRRLSITVLRRIGTRPEVRWTCTSGVVLLVTMGVTSCGAAPGGSSTRTTSTISPAAAPTTMPVPTPIYTPAPTTPVPQPTTAIATADASDAAAEARSLVSR
jgi:hypothetical protein